MTIRLWSILLLLSLASAVSAQTKSYRFSKRFIQSHYASGHAIGTLAANASAPGPVHATSCGGEDGEMHVGIEGSALDNQGIAVSGPATGGEEFGVVAEPPNVRANIKAAIDGLRGQPIEFTGYFRVWNEGHDVGPLHASNPHHVLELHPAWGVHGANVDIPPRGSRVFSMSNYAGYGASRFRPLLTGFLQQKWLKVSEDDDFVFIQLLRADNFYQLPIVPRQVTQIPRGVVAIVDVFSDEAHQNLIFPGLRLITPRGSRASSQLQVNTPTFMLGFFSVNLATAMQVAVGHRGANQAAFAPDALEFFAFGRPLKRAVASSACDVDEVNE